MTLEETQKVLAYVTAAYPRYFANVTQESARNMGKVWTDALMDYTVEAVMTGVRGYISADNSGFPPSPGQIIGYIHMVGKPADKSGTEAWSLVRRAVNVPWDQFEASYATLPRLVQIAVGSSESLKEMAQMDTERFETVAQSNFLRMYETARRRAATEEKFTGAVIGAKDRLSLELQKRSEQRHPELTQKQEALPVKEDVKEPTVEAPIDHLAQLRMRLGKP